MCKSCAFSTTESILYYAESRISIQNCNFFIFFLHFLIFALASAVIFLFPPDSFLPYAAAEYPKERIRASESARTRPKSKGSAQAPSHAAKPDADPLRISYLFPEKRRQATLPRISTEAFRKDTLPAHRSGSEPVPWYLCHGPSRSDPPQRPFRDRRPY